MKIIVQVLFCKSLRGVAFVASNPLNSVFLFIGEISLNTLRGAKMSSIFPSNSDSFFILIRFPSIIWDILESDSWNPLSLFSISVYTIFSIIFGIKLLHKISLIIESKPMSYYLFGIDILKFLGCSRQKF